MARAAAAAATRAAEAEAAAALQAGAEVQAAKEAQAAAVQATLKEQAMQAAMAAQRAAEAQAAVDAQVAAAAAEAAVQATAAQVAAEAQAAAEAQTAKEAQAAAPAAASARAREVAVGAAALAMASTLPFDGPGAGAAPAATPAASSATAAAAEAFQAAQSEELSDLAKAAESAAASAVEAAEHLVLVDAATGAVVVPPPVLFATVEASEVITVLGRNALATPTADQRAFISREHAVVHAYSGFGRRGHGGGGDGGTSSSCTGGGGGGAGGGQPLLVIEDRGTPNGTFVNGVRIAGAGPAYAAALRVGNEVRVGGGRNLSADGTKHVAFPAWSWVLRMVPAVSLTLASTPPSDVEKPTEGGLVDGGEGVKRARASDGGQELAKKPREGDDGEK